MGRADAVAAGGMDAVFEMFFKAHDRFGVMSRRRPPAPSPPPFDAPRAASCWVREASASGSSAATAGDRADARGHGEILGVGAASAAVSAQRLARPAGAAGAHDALALEDAGV